MGNYNIKSIMLGIGIGLVFSSMINISMDKSELSVEEIKLEALRHDLIVLTKDEIINNQPSEKSETEVPTPENTSSEKPALENNQTKTVDSEVSIKVEILSGMSSEAITKLLKENGVISDEKAFQRRLRELNVENKLKIGIYNIPKGSNHDEIIRMLTR